MSLPFGSYNPEGRVADLGTYQQLVARDDLHRRLYASQLRPGEDADNQVGVDAVASGACAPPRRR